MSGNGKRKTDRNTDNLMPPWKPGDVPNPKGRPKGSKDGPAAKFRRIMRSATPEIARKRIEAMLPDNVCWDDVDLETAAILRMAAIVFFGDPQESIKAFQEIADRMYGKAAQQIDAVVSTKPIEHMDRDELNAAIRDHKARIASQTDE